MQFTVGTSALTVTALGRNYLSGNSQTHTVKIVNAATGVDVAGATVQVTMVSGTPNAYQYAALSTPIQLAAATPYFVVSQEFSGGDTWYDYAPVTAAKDATVNGPSYQGPSGAYILVGAGSLSNWSYETANFQYTLGSPFVLGATLATPRNNYNGYVGMQFTVGAQPLTVTSLGRIYVAGNTGTHTLKLVSASTGQDVAGSSTQISMSGGVPSQLKYVALSNPIILAANATYYLVSLEASGGDQWYDLGPITASSVASVQGGVYTNATVYAFVPSPNTSYGPVGFTYGGSSTPFITGQTLGSLRSNFTGFVGLRFGVGASALTVTSLGRFCAPGDSQTHTVKLVQGNGQDLPGGSVSVPLSGCTVGQYAYGTLASPVKLSSYTTWDVVSSETAGSDQWYDDSPVTSTTVGTIVDAIYAPGTSTDVAVPVQGYSYGPVNLQYTSVSTASTVTTPTPTLPPTVALTAPASNATVSGVITISATATANSGLTLSSVQFQQNGTNIGSAVASNSSSFSVQLNTATLSNGTYSLTAIATDSAGNSTTATAVSVTVSNAVAPNGTVFITNQSFGSARNNFSGYVGMQFTLSGSTLAVNQLGRMCISGNSGSHTLELLNSSGAVVSGGTVSVSMAGCVPGAYTYGTLASPVTLSASSVYFLLSLEASGGDQWYDYGPVAAQSVGSVNGPVYMAKNVSNLVSVPGYAYVPLNFTYTVSSTTAPSTPVSSTTPPTVSLTAPASNSVLSGSVTVSAVATAAPGLTMQLVQFQRTNQNIGPAVTGAGPNYSTTLDTRQFANGEYSISPIAVDSAGNTTFGNAIGVTIYNNITPPTVSVTSPASGSAGTGTITVSATATPASGVSLTSLQLQIDGQNFGAACASATCTAVLDTTLLPNGTHRLTAIAIDSDEGHAVSPAVPLSANNTVTGIGVLNGYLPGSLRTFGGWIGMQFTTGCSQLSVTSLGRIFAPGNTGTHAIKLVLASTGADVPGASTTVSFTGAIANRIIYGSLSTPVTLAANTAYYLVSQETASGDQFYDYLPILAVNAVTVNGPAYQPTGNAWQAPSNTNYSYEPVDFKFTVPGVPFPVPVTPTSVTSTQASRAAISPANYNHLLVTGQSLSVGATGGPPLTLTQPYSNVMLNTAQTAFLPLAEGVGNMSTVDRNVESVDSSMGNTITRLSGQTFTDLVTNAGVVGYSYAQLAKGTAPYAVALTQLNAGKTVSQAAGGSFKISAVSVIHGETDDSLGTTAAAYEADLVQWQNNYQTDGQAISGQGDPIPFFIDQENSWVYFNLATTTVALGQLSAAVDNPSSIFIVGPKYQYHYNDGVHLDDYGYREQGEQFGKVMKQVLLGGQAWKPFGPASIIRSGNIITVKYNVPAPPLQFDTSTVLPKAGMGYEYTDGTACSPFIVSAQITAGDTVTITLSATPAGTAEHLRYAITGIPGASAGKDAQGAPRGNLKDSDATVSAYGNDLSNWALAFDKTVTKQ